MVFVRPELRAKRSEELGGITLDENKTNDPRAWALDPGVVVGLRAWRDRHPLREKGKDAPPDDARVFVTDEGIPVSAAHLPDTLRDDLIAAGVKRPELHEATKTRLRLRVHDLRGTFVTIALATGRSEAWVQDRTGHRSSNMVNRYRRISRTVAELGLGSLAPMNEAIPEFRTTPRETPPDGKGEESFTKPFSDEDSGRFSQSSGTSASEAKAEPVQSSTARQKFGQILLSMLVDSV